MPIRALIFDMGRVLVDINFALLPQKFPDIHFDVGKIIKFSPADDPTFLEFECGTLSPEDFHQYICRKFALNLTFEQFNKVWTGFFVPMPGMETLVAELQAAGRYTLGLLSDTDPLHWEYIGRMFPWIAAAFANPTLSYREGITKPAREIFLRAAANVGCIPENCLFIDDREDNVEAARACGMSAIRFVGNAELRRELQRL